MSYLLRSTLQHSCKRFRISYFTKSDCASRVSPITSYYFNQQRSGLHIDVNDVRNISSKWIMTAIKKINVPGGSDKERSLRRVDEHFERIKSAGVELDISHYNALLEIYVTNELPFAPADVLSELKQRGLKPNVDTYKHFITRYCDLGDIEEANRILQLLREKDIPHDRDSLNGYIACYSMLDEMANAEEVLNILRQAGKEITPDTYARLICGYIRQKDTDKVRSMMEEVRENSVRFTDRDYLDIIYHLSMNDFDIDKMPIFVERTRKYKDKAKDYIEKLIDVGEYESAFKILKTMFISFNSLSLYDKAIPFGGFFITGLIRNDAPFAEVIKYCDRIVEEKLNLNIMSIALEKSLRLKKESLAHALLRAAKERDFPIRTHYFWPLIIARGNANDTEGIYKLLSIMRTEFDLTINLETVCDYVLPFVLKNDTNIKSLMLDLKACGVRDPTAANALVMTLLWSRQLDEAAEVALAYRCYYSVSICNQLMKCLLKTSDVKPLTTIFNQIVTGIQWRTCEDSVADEDDKDVPDYREIIGLTIFELVVKLKTCDANWKTEIKQILKNMYEKDVEISDVSAELIQIVLQGETQEISELLGKYCSVVEQSHPADMKISSTILEMEHDKYVLSDYEYNRIIDSCVQKNKFDDAWRLLMWRSDRRPDFTMNPPRMLTLAYLALKNEQYDKALEILNKKARVTASDNDQSPEDDEWQLFESLSEKNPRMPTLAYSALKNEQSDEFLEVSNKKARAAASDNDQSPENTFNVTGRVCWCILNHFAEKGDAAKVKEFFDLIINNKYCTVEEILLRPLIEAHLVKDDLKGAVAEFEACYEKYRKTPLKWELTKRCIKAEDDASLQEVFDISTVMYGENNSLNDLMLSYLECGKLNHAKKILTTPGFRLGRKGLRNACQRYRICGSIEHLENLIKLTKNVTTDRPYFYYNLLLAYDRAGEPQKALSLWERMEEENEIPSNEFLIRLADLLQRNNMPVPFAIPKTSTQALPRKQQSETRDEMNQYSIGFRELLGRGYFDEALKFKNCETPAQLNDANLLLLIEPLLNRGKYRDAKEVFEELLSRGVLPTAKTLKYLFGKATGQGDVELLEKIKPKLDAETRSYTRFHNRLGNAYVISGRADEYLDKLEKGIDSADSEDEVEQILKTFSKSVLFSLLETSPQYIPRMLKIAGKCLIKNREEITLMNALWCHHIMQNNDEEAEKIWINYLQNTDRRISFKDLCNAAMKKGNLQAMVKLKDFLERKPISSTPEMLGIVYGFIIKILVDQNKVHEAVQVLKEADAKVKIENIISSAVQTLKAACISKNIPFEYYLLNDSKDAGERRQ